MKTILVTGGAGYIGSHTCVELLNENYEVIVLDNFCNSCIESLNRVEQITGKSLKFYEADMRDKNALEQIFTENKIDAVIHFAGLKIVNDSIDIPLDYYDNNIGGTVALLEVMQKYNCKKIIFSSSASLYNKPETLPIDETCNLSVSNPYARTKLMIEEIMRDLYVSDNAWSIILLRYFNPIGAHESGLIGEDPKGIPTNIAPYVAQVASGKLEIINVFGNDYNTPDGTGVRDYIHVVDLAKGHTASLKKIETAGVHIYNLGTGVGYTVFDFIHAFEKACGKILPYKICPRRNADIESSYAKADKAYQELGWKAERNLDDMCASLWKWQQMNPDGYNTKK